MGRREGYHVGFCLVLNFLEVEILFTKMSERPHPASCVGEEECQDLISPYLGRPSFQRVLWGCLARYLTG